MAVFPLASLGIKAIQANADITVSMVNTAGATVTAVYPANVPISFGDLASITITPNGTKISVMKNLAGYNGEPIQVFRVDDIITVA